jgi:putative ABC transport system substrate-binding protein
MRAVVRLALSCAFGFAVLSVDAQPTTRIPRIGVLAERSPPSEMLTAFADGLRELGYVDGRNVVIEWRYVKGASEQYAQSSAELVGLNVDVIVVGGSLGARAAKAATTTIPIVFTSVGDPVAFGLVASLSRPGGNITGISNVATELSGKQLEFLKAAVPTVSRVAVLHDPRSSDPALKVTRAAARNLGLQLELVEVRKGDDLGRAFSVATSRRADAVLGLSSPVLGTAMQELARLAAASRLPSIYGRSEYAAYGGLLAYGPDFSGNYRRAATYVDKILKGAKPADLPIEQPTTFELVVNVTTAKKLGLTIPQSLLQRADRVIE